MKTSKIFFILIEEMFLALFCVRKKIKKWKKIFPLALLACFVNRRQLKRFIYI
jgi:hypothetical protein